jgi:parallel beta-helix repeat protein
MVMQKETNYGYQLRKKTASAILVWILIASGIFVIMPLLEPKVGAPLVHDASAQWEDQDFGGGLDYNGDPAGDKKITWHASNNSHIVDTNFFVQDNYILELEAGAIVQVDPNFVIQVGAVTGASFYANGTMATPVMMGPNSTGFWGGIYLVSGSYSSMEYVWIDQADLFYVESSTLDVNASAFTNMNSFGIYGSLSTVMVSSSAFMGSTNSPGMYMIDSDLSVDYCLVSDALTAGIYLESSNATITNSDLYGFNATDGANGDAAIYVTGSSSYVNIMNNNNIIGGNGGGDTGSGGGDGGEGIYVTSYNGKLTVTGNQKIQGGEGGVNYGSSSNAGDGGYGMYVTPISDLVPQPAVNISSNTQILGGRGGDNEAVTDGDSGSGFAAIRLLDSPIGSGGNAVISQNTDIIGGRGGHNSATASSGWTVGEGGEGIYLNNIEKPASVLVTQNPNIKGGAGGNNSGTGDLSETAGDGASGILLYRAEEATISQCTVTGGDGGTNMVSGIQSAAGNGGNGIFLYYPTSSFSSSGIISGCTISGGKGGDDYVGTGTPMSGGAGTGGSGVYSSQSSGSLSSSDVIGGAGGNNLGSVGEGGFGGYGAAFFNSFSWSVSGLPITGGKGGDNFGVNGGGGGGGFGAVVSDSNTISFTLVVDIKGGDGGDADIGDFGPGDAAMNSVYIANSNDISIARSNIRPGVGGYNATSGEYGTNGSVGIFSDNIGGLSTFSGNDVTTNLRGGNTYGIRVGFSSAGLVNVLGNNIYTNNVGVFVTNSNGVSISGNNIFDNNFGVYFDTSNAQMGTGNIVSGNNYGVYCLDSSPTITGDLITNSGTIGMFFTSNSNAIIEGITIEDSGVWNVYSEDGTGSGSTPMFYNSSLFAGIGAGEFYQTGDSHPWLLNTTFDKTKTGFGDTLSNITVNWYMHILVIDTGFLGVSGATVYVNDTGGKNLDILTTDATGWARWNVYTEYSENTSGYEFYHTPHNVSAWESGRYGNAQAELTLSRDVIIMLDGMSFDLPVSYGWNMISIAVNQSSTLIADVLSPYAGKYDAVQWFDPTDSKDPWKHYHVSKDPALNDLTDIDKTRGIWIHMKSNEILSITGLIPIPTQTDIQLSKGWNFVGYPSMTKRVAGDGFGEAFETINGFVDMVQYFDATASSNKWLEWDPGAFSPDDLAEIKMGMGLWIHVTSDCIWTVDW